MKKIIALITLTFLLVVFPLFSSGAFADFIGTAPFPMKMLSDPVNILLLGSGLMFAGTRA